MRSRRPLAEAGVQLGAEPAAATDPAHRDELRSFGRRRGRRLSARQQHLLDVVLPRVALAPALSAQSPAAQFPAPVAGLWLEIGFGGGEHLIWQARANPEVGLIGCEVFEDGVVKALSAIDEGALGNVRISTEDAREVLRAAARRLPRPGVHPVSRPLAQEAPRQAPAHQSRAGRRAGPRHAPRCENCASPPISATTCAPSCSPCMAHADFAWQVAGPAGLARRGGPIGRRHAMRRRPAGRAVARYFLRFLRREAAAYRRTHPLASRVTIP